MLGRPVLTEQNQVEFPVDETSGTLLILQLVSANKMVGWLKQNKMKHAWLLFTPYFARLQNVMRNVVITNIGESWYNLIVLLFLRSNYSCFKKKAGKEERSWGLYF